MTGFLLKLRTGMIVALVTALVWVLAESRTLGTKTIEVTVALSAGGAGEDRALAVRAEPGSDWTGDVKLELEGSASRVSTMINQLKEVLTLTVGRELPSREGVSEVDLREALRQTELFNDSGVTIAGATPEVVRIEVAKLVAFDIPVEVVVDGADVDGNPQSSPAAVRLVAPKSAMDELDPALLAAVARVGQSQVRSLTPGRLGQVPGVRVEAPPELRGGWATTVTPSQVTIDLTLRNRTSSYTLPTLPVQVLLAPTELDRWHIEIADADAVLTDVVLTGPSDLIQRIRDREFEPVALVRLSYDELERGIASKPATIAGLPAGVTAELNGAEIGLTVTRREASTGSPGQP